MPTGVPTDVVGDDLVATYRGGIQRLETIITAALRRGLDPSRVGTAEQRRGDATAAYRARQLAQAQAILTELEQRGRELAPAAARRAYVASLFAVDNVLVRHGLGNAALAGQFGGVHQARINYLAANLERSLTRATRQAGDNVAAVFARADALTGPLGPGRAPLPGFPFVGRRQDDPYRSATLRAIAEGDVALDTRRQVSRALAERLIREGTTDALTGFVDRAGRRWSLGTYTAMAARTTTREATTAATVGRLRDHGQDLVTISSHPHVSDECDDYDGQTFSLSGDDARYPVLDDYPPFHPNCEHVVTPAAVNLDDYMTELERQAGAVESGGAAVDAPPSSPPPSRPPLPPPSTPAPDEPIGSALGAGAQPITDAGTIERLDAQREAYAFADPGPEPGAAEAWAKYVDREARAANKSLNTALGDFNVKWLDRKWATEQNLRGRILNGEVSLSEAEDLIYHQWQETEGRRVSREAHNEADYGYKKTSIPCFSCGHLKRRPADVCQVCGDDPVPAGAYHMHHGGASPEERQTFNREYGYAPV